jgi:general secretion pathway protein K
MSPALRHPAKRGAEGGAVLVLVLVCLLAMVSVVVAMLDKGLEHALEPARLAEEERAGVLAAGGLDVALGLLARDEDSYADTPLEPWAATGDAPVIDQQGLSVRILPANSRLDLNHALFGPEPTPLDPNTTRSRVLAAIGRLLEAADMDPQAAAALQDWIDEDANERLPGAEGFAYDARAAGYAPRNAPLPTAEELLLVEGFTAVEPEWVRERFTVFAGGEPKLNLNFAPVEVLEALLPELAPYREQIRAFLAGAGFEHVSQLLVATHMPEELYAELVPFLTVTSEAYEVLVEARSGDWLERRRYVVRRASSSRYELVRGDVLFSGLAPEDEG